MYLNLSVLNIVCFFRCFEVFMMASVLWIPAIILGATVYLYILSKNMPSLSEDERLVNSCNIMPEHRLSVPIVFIVLVILNAV